MDCRQVDRLMEANLEGRLSGFERMALRQHLKSCPACRAKLDALTAFSERMAETLAGAEAPDWARLAPPGNPPAPTAVPPTQPSARGRAATPAPARAKRKSWSPLGVAVAGAAIIAVVVPFWAPPQAPVGAPTWLDAAIAAEATRRAAGARLDLVTGDVARAAAWFDRRGVAALPPLQLPDAVRLEGAFLTWYDGARVAGLALATPAGPVTLHLRPRADAAPAAARAAGERLEAVAAGGGDWRAAVIGAPAAVEGSGIDGWLPAALLAAPAGG